MDIKSYLQHDLNLAAKNNCNNCDIWYSYDVPVLALNMLFGTYCVKIEIINQEDNMGWTIIATWPMSYDGVCLAADILRGGGNAFDAAEVVAVDVEDNPEYTSVGRGGLPNENGEVQLDAAFMDGSSMRVGAVAGMRGFKNPVKIARALMAESFNNFLVGTGAESYAASHGFDREMLLTEKARGQWLKGRDKLKNGLSAYDGHDTVGIVALDSLGTVAAATSTSGLFMKREGRIGDTAIFGSGLYADSLAGGAAATGVGEDIMKGCVSFHITDLLKSGKSAQQAAEEAVRAIHNRLVEAAGKARDISVVCVDKDGGYGAASNIDSFEFVVATDKQAPAIIKSVCVV